MPCRMTMLRTVLDGGAERDADPDFLRPLLHRVRHQAVDADRRQHERGSGERRQQDHVEVRSRRRPRDDSRPSTVDGRRKATARDPQLASESPR